ncbi:MAG: HlyD family efflux transporter periplasmic adaptor subunit, partial [Planctomycetota bacterium]
NDETVRYRLTSSPLIPSVTESSSLGPERPVGAWLIFDRQGSSLGNTDGDDVSRLLDGDRVPPDLIEQFVSVSAPRVADQIQLLSRIPRWHVWMESLRSRPARWLMFAVAIAGACAATWIPMPYTVRCNAVVAAHVRSFVVAPHDGLILRSDITAGDEVQAGQTLAEMDGRTVQWEISGLSAEHQRSVKEHDAQLAEGNAARAQASALQARAVAVRQELLLQRQQNLRINSPATGIVLDSPLERVENAPVKMGDPLFEIASLERVDVEIEIPASESPHVRTGDSVAITFAGQASAFDAKIHRLSPMTEIREGQNVMIAIVDLDNPARELRPGMSADVAVHTRPRSVAWILFHKPWSAIRRAWPF